MQQSFRLLCLFFGIGLFSLWMFACSPTKHIAEGEYLLDKVEIKSDAKEIDKNELPDFIRQMPNSKILGLFRMQLGFYNFSGQDTTKRGNRILRRIGQEPVVLDSMLTDISSTQLLRYHMNKGYYDAEINTVVSKKNKRARVSYEITSHKPYRINDYEVELTHPVLKRIAKDSVRSLIQKNTLFDSYQLDRERERLTSGMRRQGYYNFMKDYLAYAADSTDRKVDLSIQLRDYLTEIDSVKQTVFKKYYISKVIYNLTPAVGALTSLGSLDNDTVVIDDYVLIGNKKKFLTLSALKAATAIRPGAVFSDAAVERTYSAFNALPPVKYTHISFSETAEDSLQCLITIAQAKTFTFSSQAELTYTDGYWGTGGNIGVMHRNLFRGAEALTLQGRYAIEKQGDLLAQEWGGQLGLRVPRILIPFAKEDYIRGLNGSTEYKTTLNYQFRPGEFTATNVGAGIKYNWQRRRQRHALDLIDLSYMHFPWISQAFKEGFLETGKYNPYNYEDYMVMRISYGTSFSGYNQNRPLHNYYSYRYSVETAGNTLYGIYKLFDLPADADGAYRAFNIRFSQYVKGEINSSYHQIIDKNNKFVYHAGLGIGFPYGNSEIIPFERRFYSGGASSVRGWGESQLGPGTYQRVVTNRRDYNQVGDIKLDLNFEYRAKMFWVLEGALFADAGNIWTVKAYDYQPGGEFGFDTFWKEIALAYGFGIRMDFNFFLFRMDLGFKLHDPATTVQNWVAPTSFKNMAFHIAIGYPF